MDKNENALKALKKRIIDNPAGYYTKIPVVPRYFDSKQDFHEECLPSLVLETLGCNHLRRASHDQALMQDPQYSDCDLIRKRDVLLYVGLTDDETEALAIQHQTDQCGAYPLTPIQKMSIVRRNWAEERGISEDEFLDDEIMPNEFKAKLSNLLGEKYDSCNLKVVL